MVEKASLNFRLRKIDETRSYLSDKTNHNDLMSEKFKKKCKHLNYTENLLILFLAITAFIWIAAFAWLIGVTNGIASSTIAIKICAATAEIKQYKSIIKKKKKKHDKMVLLGKDKLNIIEVLICKVLLGSYLSHDKFV